MNPELQNTLASLAQKLGTSIEHLFPIMVSHARASAITGIVFGTLGLIPAVLCLKWAIKILKGDDYSDLFPVAVITAIVGGIAVIVLPIMAACAVPDAIYPEAAAIHSLTSK